MTKGQLVTAGLSALAPRYDAMFCDIWGVVHNGVEPHPRAVSALRRFRDEGRHVVLITNASRPSGPIVEMLLGMGINNDIYDRVVSSGDVTRELVRKYAGKIVHHVGPRVDHPIFAGLGIAIGPPEDAAAVVVTGLDAEAQETPDDYAERIADWLDRRLPLICANPDITVEWGDQIVYCAGALAKVYADKGGHVEMGGKPHPPIYELAFHELETLAGRTIDRKRILAIGDAVRTDALGAARYGLDFLFITGSLHAEELNAHEGADEARVVNTVAPSRANLVGHMPRLVW
ncbi:MAG: TIGR01459 family HAD-type hydrolase [Alphaproteobacteria bacterium]|nr:TIGR01459 family HAD-type hydrolase [Alphaproteobacteria bacterium]